MRILLNRKLRKRISLNLIFRKKECNFVADVSYVKRTLKRHVKYFYLFIIVRKGMSTFFHCKFTNQIWRMFIAIFDMK
ncbi:hypothetical protein H5410_061060 [Solanum commersonii]|uniref:Uncharacterized protein n=1 Tax=Solanum commersonii TaxID=4109 RepID=A0A9J5W8F4_SOLCO|nr:hypothetical protein H5410_061060 [Solanum commersonii]